MIEGLSLGNLHKIDQINYEAALLTFEGIRVEIDLFFIISYMKSIS